ncbi:MAG TPA: cation:proton antiporter [Bdellovibrionota bacterium]|nr:cation:proton antiporter [Bdellovibrionota bacterium]
MSASSPSSPELLYVTVLFGLFVIPRVLQRFRVPTAVTCFLLGSIFGAGFGWFQMDATIRFLSLLGIVSLFLFAGLEVDFGELRTGFKVVLQHLILFLLGVAVLTALGQAFLGLNLRPAIIVALALLTPSTGFILDSLPMMGLQGNEPFWVKSKAIATEMVALIVLFVTLQSTTWGQFSASLLILAAMVFALPSLFRFFAQRIAPFAPKSEFAFLLMMAILCAFITRKLGVYYLVGAFVVGLAARRYREFLPAVASEQMLHAVEVFASFFIPFYFFGAGLELQKEDVGLGALGLGILFLFVLIPARILWVALHRKLALKESMLHGMRVSMSIVPTLVFTLVLAQILRTRFSISPVLYGALIVYALVTTLAPSFLLRLPPPDFDTPELDQLPT